MSYAPKSVADAWKNHFDAFGAQDVPKILLDYDEKSVVTVWNTGDDSKAEFKGVEGAKKLFQGLFADLKDLSTLKAPHVQVDEDIGNGSGQVFLVWECAGCGYKKVTDTFIFRPDFKIGQQNIVAFDKSSKQSKRGSLSQLTQEHKANSPMKVHISSTITKNDILQKTFAEFDKDDSNTITSEELTEMFKSLKWEHSPEHIEVCLKYLDKDANSEISFDEFLQWTEYAWQSKVIGQDSLEHIGIHAYVSRGRRASLEVPEERPRSRSRSPSLSPLPEDKPAEE